MAAPSPKFGNLHSSMFSVPHYTIMVQKPLTLVYTYLTHHVYTILHLTMPPQRRKMTEQIE